MPYQAIYYRDERGHEPVNEFIDGLDPRCQDEVDWYIDLLNGLSDSNPELAFPYSSALKGTQYRSFRELRASCGRARYRILFRRSGRFFILLHAFQKEHGRRAGARQGDRIGAVARLQGAHGLHPARRSARDGTRRPVTTRGAVSRCANLAAQLRHR